LVACLINEGAVAHLLGQRDGEVNAKGMAQIIVARMEKNQYLVSSILVDYWCLGVKNALFKKCDMAIG
jgi:hypothetical protein